MDDAGDVRAYRKGDMRGFHRLYTRYDRRVFFYIRSMVRDEHLAEDLFQDVWLQVARKLGGFAFRGEFRNWLFTIAHHRVIDHQRQAKLQQTVYLDEPVAGERDMTYQDVIADPAPDIIRQLTTRELYGKVRAVVGLLPAPQRETFLLRVDAGLKFREIAAMLRVPLNTVLGRMHYAVTAIRTQLKDEL